MYKWHVILKDGTQLDESRGFGLNEEERKNCKIFSWINEETKHSVSVDLETGVFYINNQSLHASRGDVENLSWRNPANYKLIYAKRHFFAYGDRLGQEEVGLYLIGWETLDENGRNIKRILYLYPNGEIMFGGKNF